MKLRRPSPALTIACLALFISLGGVSYGVATGFIDSRELRDNTIRTQDLRNNDVRGRDIRNSTIQGRDVALNTLRGGDIDESRIGKVGDADRLDGLDSSGFLRPDAIGFAALTVASGWTPGTAGDVPQFDVDPLGNTWLRGTLTKQAGAPDIAAVLPPGARPPSTRRFAVWAGPPDAPTNLTVGSDGVVRPTAANGQQVSLDGVVFRAGSP